MTTTMNVKLLQIVKTTAQWSKWDEDNAKLGTPVVLSAGLLLVEDCGSGVTRVKVGDGIATQFANLKYISYPDFTGTTGTGTELDPYVAGKSGFVPAPGTEDKAKFLRGDGTWADTPNYTAVAGGESSASSGSYDQVLLKKDGTTISTVDLGLFADSASGKDEAGKIKSALLPSYVDDIIEGYYNPTDGKFYTSKSGTTYSGEITPQAGVIYVDLDTDGSYRWSGSAYINISNPIDAQAIYNLMDTDTNGAYSATKHGLVPAYGSGNGNKILRGDGWTNLATDSSLSVSTADVSNVKTTTISLNAATITNDTPVLGGVSVAATSSISNTSGAIDVKTSDGLTKDANGNISVAAATSSTIGGVIVPSSSAISVGTGNDAGKIDVNLASGGGITKDNTGALKVDDFTAPTTESVGTHGLVPAPQIGDGTKFLRGDKTWVDLSSVGVTSVVANNGTTDTTFAKSNGKVTIATNGTYDATDNKIATQSTVTNAIGALDVPSTGTGAITGFGTDKTLATLTETDGLISATFQDISIATSNITASSLNDNITAGTALSTSSNKLVTERAVANAGYITGISIDGTTGTTFTGIAKSATINGGTTINADSTTGNIALTGLVTGVSVNGTAATVTNGVAAVTAVTGATMNGGNVTVTNGVAALGNVGTVINYTNSSGTTGTINVGNDGTFDLTDLTLQCTL